MRKISNKIGNLLIAVGLLLAGAIIGLLVFDIAVGRYMDWNDKDGGYMRSEKVLDLPQALASGGLTIDGQLKLTCDQEIAKCLQPAIGAEYLNQAQGVDVWASGIGEY